MFIEHIINLQDIYYFIAQQKMSKKLDLNNYLNKYLSNPEGKSPHLRDSGAKFNQSGDVSISKASRYQTQSDLNYQQVSRGTTRQSSNTFQKAQYECLEELQEVRRVLAQEQKEISSFINNYHKRIIEDLHREHNRIRQQVLQMFDRAFLTNEKRIDEALSALNSNDIQQFVKIRQRISQIHQDINRLQQGLKSSNYRPVIAEVVTSDFDTVTKDLRALINNTEKIVYENSPKLRINDECIRRLQQDLLNIIVLDAHKETKGKAEPSPQEQKRPPRGKLSLFQPSKEPQKGSFFNFK